MLANLFPARINRRDDDEKEEERWWWRY